MILLLLPAPCRPGLPGALFQPALWSVIWPDTLSKMAGYNNKALALAAGNQITTIMGFSAPFVGSLSDKLPERFACIGRRRPFIIVGNLISMAGLAMTYDALYRIVDRPAGERPLTDSERAWAYMELAASLVIGNLGGSLFAPPWSAIVPETVPLTQRGLCVMVQSWCNCVIGIIGSIVGYMVGEGTPCFGREPCFTVREIWWVNIWIILLQIPFYCLACNGTAFDGCSARGVWKPERATPPAPPSPPAPPAAGERTDRRSRCHRWKESFAEFASAFRDPCFKWLWVFGLVSQVGSMITGQFSFFWYQDCFPHGCVVPTHAVTCHPCMMYDVCLHTRASESKRPPTCLPARLPACLVSLALFKLSKFI